MDKRERFIFYYNFFSFVTIKHTSSMKSIEKNK
jgi:hypothetical protein